MKKPAKRKLAGFFLGGQAPGGKPQRAAVFLPNSVSNHLSIIGFS